jgi:hypothetical protein
MGITETVLEMHYHRPVMDAIRSTLGLGPQGSINFYKYSTQRECFVGFDQAYAVSELSEAEFFELLKGVAASSRPLLGDQFFGYFLQFKVVKEMERFNRYTPTAYIAKRPHYRIALDTKKNANTGMSQHELLYNLNKNKGALVYYACPMLFDKAALYEVNVDLDSLRLADFSNCASPYLDNDNHYIYFNDKDGDPVWCSDPVKGESMSSRQLAERIATQELSPNRAVESAKSLLDMLTDFEAAGLDAESKVFRDMLKPSFVPMLADTLTVVRVSRGEGAA